MLRLDKETARDLGSVPDTYGEDYMQQAHPLNARFSEGINRLGRFGEFYVALGGPGRIA